ncbi:hypothetical protein UFOVP273_105 [uncultured Caudovirales phage]|uniref:Uncharacterized protein n=1 Tax=uncultured Caudovirales phage TaxID=2100421 RepID=A0A6J5LNJ9_9CAUD|nr:hypothetical protein UFOVP273_105 [uncultured Caudovirales phage]
MLHPEDLGFPAALTEAEFHNLAQHMDDTYNAELKASLKRLTWWWSCVRAGNEFDHEWDTDSLLIHPTDTILSFCQYGASAIVTAQDLDNLVDLANQI